MYFKMSLWQVFRQGGERILNRVCWGPRLYNVESGVLGTKIIPCSQQFYEKSPTPSPAVSGMMQLYSSRKQKLGMSTSSIHVLGRG